jgi:predicted membrane protein (TIGR00267 family)
MDIIDRIRFLLRITQSQSIARRYFVVNGFDGALTMLGLTMGFYVSGGVEVPVAIGACLGAAIALGMSGVTSAYISEAAERQKSLRELEEAMVKELDDSAHADAAKQVPFLIAAVNGLAPFVMSIVVITPLWLAELGVRLPAGPFESAIALAFVTIFLLGVFLGKISGMFWLWSGLRAILVALITALLILFLDL